MSLLALAMLAAAPAQMPVLDPTRSSDARCPPISRHEAARRDGKLGARRLADLPAADAYRAVYRRIGGCVVPNIAAYGLGRPR